MKTKLLYNTKEKLYYLRVIDKTAEIKYQQFVFDNKKEALRHQNWLINLHTYKTFI